ncbi:MAG: dihydrodipicolinate synthase family protein [Acidobacteriota bacterium]
MLRNSFKGIFIALTTPFEEEEISLKYFSSNLEKYNQSDVTGYVVLGTTGESAHLDDNESMKLLETARKVSSKGKKIIAGAARESTHHTIQFTNQAAEMGIEAALVRTPGYFKNKINREALKKHYLTLADSAKIPIIIYHIPQNTGISLPQELLCELAEHPNISGIKDSSGNLDFLTQVISLLPVSFNYLLGAGSLIFSGLSLGISGGILALAAVVPNLGAKLYTLFHQNKLEEARCLQLELAPLNACLTQVYGVSGLKYALDRLGFYGGLPRSPLLPLDQKGKEQIDGLLKKLGLI